MFKKRLYQIAIVISVVIYVAGVATGVITQRYFSSKTQEEITSLNQQMSLLKTSMENLQLQQLYLSVTGKEQVCNFLISSIDQMENQLAFFRDKLPQRLEEFEQHETVNEQYQQLKRDYSFVLLRTWILSLNLRDQCNAEIIPILYFYSRDCTDCLNEGLVLDRFKINKEAENKKVMIFTIDLYMEEPILTIIKNTYNITKAPSIVIGKTVYNGYVNDEDLRNLPIS